MGQVELFISQLEKESHIFLVSELHQMIVDIDPHISSSIRYNIPFYDLHKWFCYINPLRSGGIEWCFIHGQEMTDPYGLLDKKDRKMIAGITLNKPGDIQRDILLFYLLEAIELDRQKKK